MGLDGMKLRIDDLKKWPFPALKKRMQLDLEMELALIDVGSGGGLHHYMIHWDRSIIEEILKKRNLNSFLIGD